MSQVGPALIYSSAGPDKMLWSPEFKYPAPGKKEVMIKTISAGLNPVDYKIPKFAPMFFANKGKQVGQDVCGKVVAVGKGVSTMAVGDVVFGFAPGCGEYSIAQEAKLAKVPEGAPNPELYGGLPVAACTAFNMLESADAFKGTDPKHVLIIGASGGVGSCAVQIARSRCAPGTKISAICSAKSAEFVKSLGADEIIDYSVEGFSFATCVPVKSIDSVIDCVTSPDDPDYVTEGMKFLKPKTGQYVAANTTKGFDFVKVGIANSIGLNLFPKQYRLILVEQSRRALNEIASMIQNGSLKLHVEKYVPFTEADIRTGYETLKQRRVRGKIIVKM